MGQKLLIGPPIGKGLRNDVTPFNIDNDSFPTLINAYQWRGRVKRKRGTQLLERLTRYFDSNDPQFNPGTPATQALVAGAGNLLTGFTNSGIQSNAVIVSGTVTIHDNTSGIDYTDPAQDGNLSGGAGGTINYASGVITISGGGADLVRARFNYYPALPVLGLEPFVDLSSDFPLEIGFDTTYSYNMALTYPYTIHNVNFYYNYSTPPKSALTPFVWNLAEYQQIWTTNYQGAMWAVPGIRAANDLSKVGMQYKNLSVITAVGAPATDCDFTTTTNHPFVAGDYVFINEVNSVTGLNLETGYVLAAPAPTATTFRARFPTATIAGGPGNTGIVQALTNSCQPGTSGYDSTKDCIRWYNGSPISSAIPPIANQTGGWVNFCPPLTTETLGTFSIADLPPAKYYLVGARMVVPFKDRLLFFGAIVQSATTGPFYLQDTIIYSQNGTPYYTCSFPYATNPFSSSAIPTTSFTAQLLPNNQTAQPSAWFENLSGYGGFITAGYARPITSVSINEDALIVGMADRQTRVLYTGNDIVPFNFYVINSELGSDSTFSSITLDRGVLSVGGRGIILTSQVSSQRVDLMIPDQVFQIKLLNAGARRICAQRDFINEWIYFTYPANEFQANFPTQTLQYNYRDDTWGLFNESYTTYGTIRKQSGETWQTLPASLRWNAWNTPWDSGISEPAQPLVIGGNAQGFVMIRTGGIGETTEGTSLFIKSFSGSTITSPNHCLSSDYIIITGCLGTIGQEVNGKIFLASRVDDNTFTILPTIDSGTYLGNGVITRIYAPYIQTKQFPVAWEMGRKTRLGVQQYLLSTTQESQVTLLIFLSQNGASPYNTGPIVPDTDSVNNGLIYSTTLYTCPESENLGLTAPNINLQMVTALQQSQIWHRVNTSLIGDTVQVGITLSDDQLSELNETGDSFSITGATNANPCVISTTAEFEVNAMVKIEDIEGITELNFVENQNNYWRVTASTSTTVTIECDSTAFGIFQTSPDATIIEVYPRDQFSEIEVHSIILDVQPSQLLA